MVLAGVADPRIYFCDIAACCSSAGRHGVRFGGGCQMQSLRKEPVFRKI